MWRKHHTPTQRGGSAQSLTRSNILKYMSLLSSLWIIPVFSHKYFCFCRRKMQQSLKLHNRNHKLYSLRGSCEVNPVLHTSTVCVLNGHAPFSFPVEVLIWWSWRKTTEGILRSFRYLCMEIEPVIRPNSHSSGSCPGNHSYRCTGIRWAHVGRSEWEVIDAGHMPQWTVYTFTHDVSPFQDILWMFWGFVFLPLAEGSGPLRPSTSANLRLTFSLSRNMQTCMLQSYCCFIRM